ncbi:MAG: hypothetical protein GX442_11175 [Candidatus Riflebacteria bacterium]|nr:hypothetical protein [Candidatus Riflebacteria bacterium]
MPSNRPSKVASDPFIREILGPLQDSDRVKVRELCQKEREAFVKARSLAVEHRLNMKVLRAEYLFDQSRLVLYFKSDIKVDFRDLLKSLGSAFRTRIELRQIGVRDETKLLGGIGCCGKEVCCAQFMSGFGPVSTKMAKDQNLSLNPAKLSGICGRLLCCLSHEHEYYASFHGKYPKVGAEICIGNEKAKVMDINFITQKALVGYFDRRKVFLPLAQIHGRKEPVTGRNLWWSQEEGQAEPEMATLLEVYQITEIVQKAKEAREAKEARKRERKPGEGGGPPRPRRSDGSGGENAAPAGEHPGPNPEGTSGDGPPVPGVAREAGAVMASGGAAESDAEPDPGTAGDSGAGPAPESDVESAGEPLPPDDGDPEDLPPDPEEQPPAE